MKERIPAFLAVAATIAHYRKAYVPPNYVSPNKK